MPPLPEEVPAADDLGVKTVAAPVPTQVRDTRTKTASRTPSLANLLKAETKNENNNTPVNEISLDDPFSEDQLREVWNTYAEQRRKLPAEFQMLSQPYRLEGKIVIVDLMSPVHETMLNAIKTDLTAFLREKLRNNNVQVRGEVHTGEQKKAIYTNREKFDFLAGKNPVLKELRDRLGLDTDF